MELKLLLFHLVGGFLQVEQLELLQQLEDLQQLQQQCFRIGPRVHQSQ